MSVITVTPMQGTVCRIGLSFTDVDGAAHDPASVRLKLVQPNGQIGTEYAIADLTHPTPGNGVYTRLFDFSISGQWTIQVETTGTPTVVETVAIGVRRAKVALGA